MEAASGCQRKNNPHHARDTEDVRHGHRVLLLALNMQAGKQLACPVGRPSYVCAIPVLVEAKDTIFKTYIADAPASIMNLSQKKGHTIGQVNTNISPTAT